MTAYRRNTRRAKRKKLVELEKGFNLEKITLVAYGMGESSRRQYICPAIGPNREGETKGAAQGADVSERKNASLRIVRPRMEEEDRKDKIIVKATAIVHDSHRPGLIYLRCIGIILRTRSVIIPDRAAPAGKSLHCTLQSVRDVGSAPRVRTVSEIITTRPKG